MSTWLVVLIIVLVLALIISNINLLHKNASQPLRKTSLNDLKETLPRSGKSTNPPPPKS